MNDDNILKRGCLVYFTCSIWGITKKVGGDVLKPGIDPEYIVNNKKKINRTYLEPISKVRNMARTFIYKKSLPFKIPGIIFIPRDMVNTVDQQMQAFQREFDAEVTTFENNYRRYVEEAREKLGKLFNPLDYPRDIRNYFSFRWDFINFIAPDHTQIISSEILQREQQKYQQTIEEFRETAITTLRTIFVEMINHIVERLSGERKIFKDSLIGNIREFINDFSALNITDDVELASSVEKCHRILDGVNIDVIRNNDRFRHDIANKMSEVKSQLNTMMVSRPLRKIRVA